MVLKFVLLRGSYTVQDILLLFMFSITEDPVKKNGAKFWSYTEELRIVIWRSVYSKYGATEPRTVTASIFHMIPPNYPELLQ
jgi:hypothetical protein